MMKAIFDSTYTWNKNSNTVIVEYIGLKENGYNV